MRSKNSGFTLAEVLVATVIGIISIAAAFASYGYFNKSYKSISQKANINNTAREALSILTKELRNTGYVDPNYLANSPENRDERTVRHDFISVSSGRVIRIKINTVNIDNLIIFNFGTQPLLKKVII